MRIALLLLLLLGVGFLGIVAMNRSGRLPIRLPGLSAGSVTQVASNLPKNCGFVMIADLRGQIDLERKGQELKSELKDSPEALKGIAELEAAMGHKLEALARVVQPASFVAALPAPGATHLWNSANAQGGELQFIFGTAVNNEFLATEAVKGWTERAGGFKSETIGQVPAWTKDDLHLCISQGWVLGATTRGALEQLLESMKGGEDLAAQPLFQRMRKELPAEVGGLFYFPLQGIAESAPGDDTTREGLKGLLYWGATAESKGGELVISSLLGVDGQNGSAFVKTLLQSPNQPLYSADFVPAHWDFYTSLNARYILGLVLEGAKLIPEYRAPALMGPGMLEAQLGISLEKDLWTALTGEVGISGNTLEKMPLQIRKGQQEATNRRYATSCMSNLKNYGTALEMYSTDFSGHYPPDVHHLTPNYFKNLPTCPTAGSDTYSGSYLRSEQPDAFTIFCQGKHHGPSGNYPQYSAMEGLIVGDAREDAPQPIADETADSTPTTVLFFAVKDQAKAEELLEKVDGKVGAPKAAGKPNVFRYEGTPVPVLRALATQPKPMLIVAIGPDAESLLSEAMDPKTPISSTAEHKKIAGRKPESWVSSSWVDMQPMITAFIPMVALDVDNERAQVLRKMLESMKDAKASSYFAVEPNGIRYLSEGNASWAAGAVGMAAAVVVPNFVRARSQGMLTACKSNEKNIGTALEMYATDFGGRYPSDLDRLKPDYLRVIPTCPSAARDTYSQTYQVSAQPDGYTFFCSGHNHAQANTPENYPQYTSIQGLIER